MTTLREEIENIIKHNHAMGQTKQSSKNTSINILNLIEKRIDKVEQDYKNELNDWGKKQPMKDMYPKEMATLERIRKELV